MQWDPVWQLCRPLEGHFPVTAGEGPRHSHRGGVGGLSMHAAPPATQIVVVPVRVTILLRLHNSPRSWTGMVGPSLTSFTIAPCVDYLLCYRIDQVA
jgi:hypothetical protein